MKKISTLWLGLATLLACSCSENSNEFHQTYFYPQTPSGLLLYADQQTDSTLLYSYDSWTARASESWFTVSPTSLTVPAGYGMRQRIDITAEPNVTGVLRQGLIQVDSYAQIGMKVSQAGWLNIMQPSPRYVSVPELPTENTTSATATGASFTMTLKADTTDTSVTFEVFKDGATLTSSEAWLTAPAGTYAAGTHKVTLAVEPNPATDKRAATLTLTSNGVSTPIEVTQNGRTN